MHQTSSEFTPRNGHLLSPAASSVVQAPALRAGRKVDSLTRPLEESVSESD